MKTALATCKDLWISKRSLLESEAYRELLLPSWRQCERPSVPLSDSIRKTGRARKET